MIAEIRTEGDAGEELRRRFAAALDFSQLKEQAGTLLMDRMKERIEESRDVGGSPLEPLSESTIAQRGLFHPYGETPLLDTSQFYQAIHFEDRGENEVMIGPMPWQDRYGYPTAGAPGRSVPERQIIGIAVGDQTDLEDLVLHHLSSAFHG